MRDLTLKKLTEKMATPNRKSEHLIISITEQLLIIDALNYYVENKDKLNPSELDTIYFLLGDLEHNNGIV